VTPWRVICCKCPIPSDGPRIQSMRDRPSPAFGEKAECVMKFVLRFWKCRKCGQLNKTIALDDTVKCGFCAQVMTTPGRPGSEPLEQVNRGVR
jgi:hypothetical protein